MTENMKKFLEAVSKNKELCEKANKLDKDALTALAKELGIELTEADFAQPKNELNDDELETVAGGKCGCMFAGGGDITNDAHGCVCAVAGIGLFRNGDTRCSCVAAGDGW